jgi:peptide chain release factor 2
MAHLYERLQVLMDPTVVQQLAEWEAELLLPDVLSNTVTYQALLRQKEKVEKKLKPCYLLLEKYNELNDWIALEDPDIDEGLSDCITQLEHAITLQERVARFSDPMDTQAAFIDLQAGSGGVEAQDWADILLRMYARFGERRSWRVTVIDYVPGDVAGIRNATLRIEGAYAYGWLKTESGVHRLVRKSPFDANHKRHTSFASAWVYPEVDDTVNIAIQQSDLRIDTYRASGAGGQHVNKTDSAVRITHMPTGTVAQCQSERSQHQNKEKAYKRLRAMLYERAQAQQRSEQQALEALKSDITWGQHIRSYVLDQSRIVDKRTGLVISDPERVLAGDLNDLL